MRLIDTTTFEFVDFGREEPVGEYAILSHRWTDSELDFQKYKDLDKTQLRQRNLPTNRNTGFGKIQWGCFMAQKQGLQYFWIDTCCIDKTSPSELDRSIRSMFKWYQKSAVCYAYLASATEPLEQLKQSDQAFFDIIDQQTRKPKDWFTRGWTLQELLAPSEMHFFDACWAYIGSRRDLRKQIQAASKIAPQYLDDFQSASVATRMHWASQRETQEDEDRAYSLFGIFGVSTDVRYGEGGKAAFLRLQEQIIQNSRDESIFAWTSDKLEFSGVLAPWLDCFADSSEILYHRDHRQRGPYRLTNQGMEFPAPIAVIGAPETNDLFYALKAQKREIDLAIYAWKWNQRKQREENVTIKLRRRGKSSLLTSCDIFERIHCDKLGTSSGVKTAVALDLRRRHWSKNIYIPQEHQEKPGDQDRLEGTMLPLPIHPPNMSGLPPFTEKYETSDQYIKPERPKRQEQHTLNQYVTPRTSPRSQTNPPPYESQEPPQQSLPGSQRKITHYFQSIQASTGSNSGAIRKSRQALQDDPLRNVNVHPELETPDIVEQIGSRNSPPGLTNDPLQISSSGLVQSIPPSRIQSSSSVRLQTAPQSTRVRRKPLPQQDNPPSQLDSEMQQSIPPQSLQTNPSNERATNQSESQQDKSGLSDFVGDADHRFPLPSITGTSFRAQPQQQSYSSSQAPETATEDLDILRSKERRRSKFNLSKIKDSLSQIEMPQVDRSKLKPSLPPMRLGRKRY